MNLLLVLLLSAGGVIGSIMILKSQFRKLKISMSNMLVGGMPLIGSKEESKPKVMPSLVGPMSNPDVAKVDTMPTGGMPQSGMIYNRAKNLEQNAGQIVNQMSGGRLTLNQNGNAQGQFTTQSIHARNVETMNPSGLETLNAKRIRTISAVNGQSTYNLEEGIGTIKGVKGGNSEYRLGKGIREIKGVSGTSKYHFEESIRKIKGVKGTSIYSGKGQIGKIKNIEGISTFNTKNGISAIKRVRGIASFAINGKVEKLKLRAPSSNNVVYSTKLSHRYTRKLSNGDVAMPIPTIFPGQVFVAPKGTATSKTNVGLAVNDIFSPKVYNLQSARYSINTTQLSAMMDIFNDPKNSDLTNKEKSRLYALKRISENDEMFGIGPDMLDRERENLDDWLRTAIKTVPELSAREQLDVVKRAKDLNSARTRRDRALAAQRANSKIDVKKEDADTIDNLLKATSLGNTKGNPLRDNLDSFIDSNYDFLSDQEMKDIEKKARENIEKRKDLTPKEREEQYKIETERMEKETKEKNKRDIEEMLKADIIEDPEKGKLILGEDGYAIVQNEFKKNRKKRDDMYARIVSRQEMSKINEYRKQNPNISAYEAKQQMQEQERRNDISSVVNQLYPEYSNSSNLENNLNGRPNIHEVRTF